MKKMSRRLRDPKLWEIIHPDKRIALLYFPGSMVASEVIIFDEVRVLMRMHLNIPVRMLRPLTEVRERVNLTPSSWRERVLAWLRSWRS